MAVTTALALSAGLASAPLVGQANRSAGRALPLAEAVGIALERSPELEGARLQLIESDQQVREARGNIFPQVNLSSTYTRNLEVPVQFLPARLLDPSAGEGELIPVRFGFDNTWQGQLRLEQPLFQPELRLGIGAAARYRSLKTEEVRGAQQEIVTRVREAYYDVLLNEEERRLIQNSLERVQQALEETRMLLSAGLAAEYDVLRLEVELAGLAPRLRRVESQVAAARRTLAVAVGLESGAEITVMGSLASLSLQAEATNDTDNAAILAFSGLEAPEAIQAEELVACARSNRTDLRQLEQTTRLHETEVRYEQAAYLPQVALFGTYSITSQDNGSLRFFGGSGSQRIHGSQLGVQVSIPLFSGFQRPARVQQKRALHRQAEAQERRAGAEAENEVRTLLDGVHEARERVEAQARAIALAQRGYEIARAQYREGMGNQLALTDAEVALRESEFNYAEAVHDYLVGRARLDEAVGVVPRVDPEVAFSGKTR
jgi:outer membrane protein